MQKSVPARAVQVFGIIMVGRGLLGLVAAVMAGGCLGTWELLQFPWIMIHTWCGTRGWGGWVSYSEEKKQGFTSSNLISDRQVQVFGSITEGKKMTASGAIHTPESLGENEGIWEARCK